MSVVLVMQDLVSMERKQLKVPPTPMSCESDYEFWEDFEKKPVLRVPTEKEEKAVQEAVKLLPAPPPVQVISQSPQPVQKPAEVLLEPPVPSKAPSLRALTPSQSSEVLSSVGRDTPTRGLDSALDEIQEKHESEVRDWQNKLDSMLAEVNAARKEAGRLQTIIFEQETVLTSLRSQLADMKGGYYAPQSRKQTVVADHDTDTKVLTSQIEAFTGLLEYYQKQADDYQKANASLTTELSGIHNRYNQEISKLRDDIREKEERLTAERDKLLTECIPHSLSEFKTNANLETRAREELNNRQTKFIESLQEELKLAKSVLQNPRLRNIMRERLKDYKDVLTKSELPEAPKPKPPAHAKSGSWSSRASKGWLRTVDPGGKVWVPKANQSVGEIQPMDVSVQPEDGRRSVETETDPVFSTPTQGLSLPKLLQRHADKL